MPPGSSFNSRGSAGGGLVAAAVRRPVAVLMMVLAVAVFGLVSLGKLQVNLLPDISYPTLTVRTEYEGAAPADVEKLVTRRLEENLAVISDLVTYRSISRAGVSDVILEFEWETPMTFAAQDVREKVDQVLPRLPQGVKRPLILRYDPTLDPIMRVALFAGPVALASQGESELYELRRIAEEEVRLQLENIPGVAAVKVRGGFEEEWRIELREDLLKLHGISAEEVADRVGQENANVAGGILRDGDRESLVRTLGEITEPRELENLVVRVQDGQPIRVRELGTVVVGHKERDVVTRVEDRESVEIEIYKEAAANVVSVSHAVKSRLFGPGWREHLRAGDYVPGSSPPAAGSSPRPRSGPGGEALFQERERPLAALLWDRGVRSRILSDQSTFIENSIREVRDAALIGALLAVLVLFVFLRRLSPTLIISVAIPISVVATFAPLFLAGVSLNIMSLGGLALGVGMLVDASIVVLESITRRRERGEGVMESAVWGTREVGLAVLASTLTTVAVFLPIVFVEGIAGEFFRDQALVVVFSLLASLIAALFFIPMLASRRFRLPGAASGTERRTVLAAVAPWAISQYLSLRSLRQLLAPSGGTGSIWRWLRRSPGILLDLLLRLPLEFAGRFLLTAAGAISGASWLSILLLGRGLHHLLRPFLAAFDRVYALTEKAFLGLLAFGLRTRFLIICVAALLAVLAVARLPRLGIELVPKVHQGEFTVETQLDVGTPVERTDQVAREVSAAVRAALRDEAIPLRGLASSAGVARDVIAKAGDGQHTARVHVALDAAHDLSNVEERAISAIRSRLAQLPEIREPVFSRPTLFTTHTSLEVEVVSTDLDRLQGAAAQVEEVMRDLPGLIDLHSTHRAGHPELVILPDREQLAFHGLSAGEVATLVRDKVQGRISTRISRGDRKVEVLVRTPREEVNEKSEVLNLQVNPGAVRPIPLGTVAQVEQQPGPAEIRRVAGERAVILSCDILDLDLQGAAQRIEGAVSRLQQADPEALRAVTVRVAGQRAESERSLRSLLFALAIATFLVYLVMASQFESLIHPFVILFSIPFALVGVVFALDWLSIKVSVVVLIGVILLVGIVVNNAIVLVDCVNQRRRAGVARDQALQQAASLRLRPILMTASTTILGLLPLALGLGEGTEIRTPMAITVIAGLTAGTLLTLVVIPVVYSVLARPGPLPAPGDAG